MGLLLAALALVILAVILGIAVIGLVVKLVWWLIVGVLIGALARLILPGSQPIGVLATALFGIAGAFFGGILARRGLHWHSTLAQLLVSIAIAAILVAIAAGSQRGRGGALARR